MSPEHQALVEELGTQVVPTKIVPHLVLLEALRAQDGHHIHQKMRELADAAGVVSRAGVALVTRGCDLGIIPPGASCRADASGRHAVLFYDDYLSPLKGHASPVDPHIVNPCARACARWGEPFGDGIFFPWGYIHRGEDPVAFHVRSFAKGHTHGRVAVAAGRLGEELIGITKTRWLFPAPPKEMNMPEGAEFDRNRG